MESSQQYDYSINAIRIIAIDKRTLPVIEIKKRNAINAGKVDIWQII